MKTIYLVRHGEGENNVQTTVHFQGPDAPLTALGKKQAAMIAERAAHLPVDALISSTMKRAHETAVSISERINKPIELSDLFVERRVPSVLTGMQRDDPELKRIRKEWEESFVGRGAERVLDGESFSDARNRAKEVFTYLEKRKESNLLVTTHGVFLRMLAAHLLLGDALTPQRFETFLPGMSMSNTGITVFKFNPEIKRSPWQLFIWNDHAHLGEN